MKIHAETRRREYRLSQGTAVVKLTPPLTTDRVSMDLFQHRYYRLSKRCMTLIGQWPYQSTRSRRGFLGFLTVVTVTGLAPLISALVRYRDDWSTVLDCINALLFATVGIIKLVCSMWNSQKTLVLLKRILTNWQVWAQDREVNILHEYSKQGGRITFLYKAMIYSTVMLYMTQPLIPKIIDVMLKNGTAPGKFPYPADYYYFDEQKYYCFVMVHFYICSCVAAMPLVASDSMLIIYVQHVCGIFAALGRKLEQIGNSDASVETCVRISSLIDRHNDAIEYADLIEATYTWNFFLIVGLGTILINLLGLQILLGTNDPESTIRFIAFAVALEVVFYIDCYISQNLMDHSINVGFYIYNSQWYRLLPKDQKVLQLMTMRCRIPCQLTAGKVLVMSMRNYGLTIRTAMSYFAVVRPQ